MSSCIRSYASSLCAPNTSTPPCVPLPVPPCVPSPVPPCAPLFVCSLLCLPMCHLLCPLVPPYVPPPVSPCASLCAPSCASLCAPTRTLCALPSCHTLHWHLSLTLSSTDIPCALLSHPLRPFLTSPLMPHYLLLIPLFVQAWMFLGTCFYAFFSFYLMLCVIKVSKDYAQGLGWAIKMG